MKITELTKHEIPLSKRVVGLDITIQVELEDGDIEIRTGDIVFDEYSNMWRIISFVAYQGVAVARNVNLYLDYILPKELKSPVSY